MINLLPLSEKQRLNSEKKEKLVVILAIVALVCIVCFSLILTSIKFYMLSEVDYQNVLLANVQRETQTADFADFNKIVQDYNKTISQLDSFYKKQVYFNKVLETILQLPAPKGLFITNLTLNRSGSDSVQVSLSGMSDTRENLLSFRESIEKDNKIKNLYFSPESWVSPENANFSLTFQINEN